MRVLSSDLQYFSCFDAEIELLQNFNVLPDDPVSFSPPYRQEDMSYFSPFCCYSPRHSLEVETGNKTANGETRIRC